MAIRKYLAAAAAVAMIAAGAAVAAPSARAATPACGAGCIALYNLLYGKTDVIAADSSGTFAELAQASNSDQTEDWVLSAQGSVTEFYQAGLVSADVWNHYASDQAYEYEYAPGGVASGYCLGTAGPANDGETVSLQPCGVGGWTLWIEDTADQYQRQLPLVNGSDTDFSYPLVLTADTTYTSMTTSMLTGGVGVIDTGQYWGTEIGVLP